MKQPIRGLIGVVHLPAMPGDPSFVGQGFEQVEAFALRDAEALVEGGVDALIVENFGSTPFAKGSHGARLEPHAVACMTLIVARCAALGVPVGVNCLRNDARSALGIAAAAGAAFIRVNVHTGAYVTDQGIIEGEAHDTLRYRAALGAEVAVLADVLVKHAAPLAPISIEDAVRDAVDRGMADAVIVTGSATGEGVRGEDLAAARAAADVPVLIGSGLTPDNAEHLAPHADGAIVGTWLKRGGRVHEPVDVDRVSKLAARLRGSFHAGG